MSFALLEGDAEGRTIMFIDQMNESECRKALEEAHVGRLGCARDNQPYVVPIFIAFDGKHIYAFTTFGKKIEWMRTNPQICLEIDDRKSHNDWTTVIIFGRYEELPDEPQFQAARVAAFEALQKRPMWWEPAYVAVKLGKAPHSLTPVFFRIHVDRMSGRRAKPSTGDGIPESVEVEKRKHRWLDTILHRHPK